MQKGILNEIDFANSLNGKIICNISENLQQLLKSLFNDINDHDIIECWKSKYFEKADIKIRIKGEIKGISIKMGKNCSLHQEDITKFNSFLVKIGVENKIIGDFNDFIKGEINKQRVDAKTYIKHNEEKIVNINNRFNESYVKINFLLRFIFQGTEIQKYGCDAIIYGTPTDFLWATKNEIIKYLINYKSKKIKLIGVSALNIKCYDRNLKNNPTRIKHQNDIQVKWYNIENDLLYITKIREANSIKNT